MDNKSSKIVKRVIGGSLLVLAGVTGFYQYEYGTLKTENKVPVVVAKNTIGKGQSLVDDNTEVVMRDKSTLVDGYYSSKDKILNSVAEDTIYQNECINQNRIFSESEYEKSGYKLVSIKGTEQAKDLFCGYEVKPSDTVDLLYYDKSGHYEGTPYLTGVTIYDIKSADGVSYANKGDGFKAAYALIWVKSDQAEEINSRQESGGYFKFTINKSTSN